jgi:hypothetical protein
VHESNLELYLTRRALHAPNFTPADDLEWRATHDADVQRRRATTPVPAGPGGVMLDYVPFHLGPRNLFLYNLVTGRVPDYSDGQGPLVTLVVSVDEVLAAGHQAVFYDGHALSAFSSCYDDPRALANFDWTAIDGTQFSNADPDRKRRKQAEFMVHRVLPWSLLRGIAVCDDAALGRVRAILALFPADVYKPVLVRANWYF